MPLLESKQDLQCVILRMINFYYEINVIKNRYVVYCMPIHFRVW